MNYHLLEFQDGMVLAFLKNIIRVRVVLMVLLRIYNSQVTVNLNAVLWLVNRELHQSKKIHLVYQSYGFTQQLLCRELKSRYWWSSQRDTQRNSYSVFNYLHNDYSNFGAYLTHRINEILNSNIIEDWKYVPTKSNAANDAARYIPLYDLNSNSRWFKGPDFI